MSKWGWLQGGGWSGWAGWALLLMVCRTPELPRIGVYSSVVIDPIPLIAIDTALANADYRHLEQMLAAGDFNQANQETWKILQQVFQWQGEGNSALSPCADLRKLNQLWQTHSKGRFGFSAQKRLWQQERANLKMQWIGDVVYRFCDRIGWGSCELTYSQTDFSLSAPIGHLPTAILPLAGEGYNPESGQLLSSFSTNIKATTLLFLGRNPGTYETLATTTEDFFTSLEQCGIK